jgi:hypothetical protein
MAMPIWLELLVLLLLTYTVGLGIGWLLFARSGTNKGAGGE